MLGYVICTIEQQSKRIQAAVEANGKQAKNLDTWMLSGRRFGEMSCDLHHYSTTLEVQIVVVREHDDDPYQKAESSTKERQEVLFYDR